MKFLVFLFFLILAAGGGYFYWWSQPEQVVNRKADALLELVSHQKINLQTQEKRAATLAETTAPEVIVKGSGQFTDGTYSRSELLRNIDTAHGLVFSLSIEETSRKLTFQSDEAWMIVTARAHLNAGKSSARSEEVRAFLVFGKEADWKLRKVEILRR